MIETLPPMTWCTVCGATYESAQPDPVLYGEWKAFHTVC